MIGIRAARPNDAAAIGAVHVAAWRSTYPGILPERYLADMSALRQAAGYEAAIRAGVGVFVAAASREEMPDGRARIVGFATAGRARRAGLGQGEVETLYVLDDFRERGVGRRLMRAAATHLAALGCNSVHVWVLRDNPARWFYERLGARRVADDMVRVAQTAVPQTAYLWDPIERLVTATAPSRQTPGNET